MTSPEQPYGNHSTRTSGVVPLFVAGVALVTAAWLAYDRFREREVHVPATARTIEPRGDLAEFEKAAIAIFENNAPSVVHITSRALRNDAWYGESVSEGTGTGFVWDERGYIVTNGHVVQGINAEVVVRFPGTGDCNGLIVDVAPDFDIAIVKLIDPPKGLRPIPLASSKDLRVGQAVFAIGNPFGLDHSLSTGVVSALDRVIRAPSGTLIQGAIQVDAAINPGNSGGPLLDSAGRLIGMNTAIVSPSGANAGIGFAIPADTINRIVPQLIQGDKGTKPGLGVLLDRYTLGGEYRPMVTRVFADSSAAAAELRAATENGGYGDVILAIDGVEVHSTEDVGRVLDGKSIGESVTMRIARLAGRRWMEMEVPVRLKTWIQRR